MAYSACVQRLHADRHVFWCGAVRRAADQHIGASLGVAAFPHDGRTSADLVRAVTEPLRGRLLGGVRAAGFRFVSLDLGGVQSGAFTLPLVTR